jgi:hypothetical protein
MHGFQFEPSAFAGSPLAMPLFAAALLGSAFSRSVPTAVAVTVVGIALASFDLVVLRRMDDVEKRVSAWVTLMAHGLVSALAAALGRAYIGTGFAVALRHCRPPTHRATGSSWTPLCRSARAAGRR